MGPKIYNRKNKDKLKKNSCWEGTVRKMTFETFDTFYTRSCQSTGFFCAIR